VPADLRSARSVSTFAADRASALIDLARLPKLNVNACGDFTLLARQDWQAERGYPETVVHSMHLDTLFLHQLHANGFTFVDVAPPAVAYHMDHSEGSGWSPEGHVRHYQAVRSQGMRIISSAELRAAKRSMLESARRRQRVLKNDDWGLPDAEVADVVVNQ
jgi:hypothetical protein